MYIYKLFLNFLKKQQKSWFKIMFIYIRGKCEDIEVISKSKSGTLNINEHINK